MSFADVPQGAASTRVVAVIRPEEIELARHAGRRSCAAYLAAGTVEEVAFTGALERLRIRLSAGVTERNCRARRTAIAMRCSKSRAPSDEQRAFGVTPGTVSRDRRAPHSRATDAALELHGVRGHSRAGDGIEPASAARRARRAHAHARLDARGPRSAAGDHERWPRCGRCDSIGTIEWLLKEGAEEVLSCRGRRSAATRAHSLGG